MKIVIIAKYYKIINITKNKYIINILKFMHRFCALCFVLLICTFQYKCIRFSAKRITKLTKNFQVCLKKLKTVKLIWIRSKRVLSPQTHTFLHLNHKKKKLELPAKLEKASAVGDFYIRYEFLQVCVISRYVDNYSFITLHVGMLIFQHMGKSKLVSIYILLLQ